MKAALHLKLSQHLTLTPQLQQSIKLLQLSTVELEQELEQYLNDNPLLEREDVAPVSGTSPQEMTGTRTEATTSSPEEAPRSDGGESNEVSDRDTTSADTNNFSDEGGLDFRVGASRDASPNDDSDEYNALPAAAPDLQQHLIEQLAFLQLSVRDRQLAMLVIAQLDDDGYLRIGLEELVTMCAEHIDVEIEDFQIALRHIQNLEPAGVAARSLAECLELQLRQLPLSDIRTAAMTVVRDHLDALASRDFVRLKRVLRVRDDDLKQIQHLIVQLDPKPGRRFSQSDTRYVVPDVFVKRLHGRWQAVINQAAVPRLKINKMYADLVHKSRDAEGKNLAGQLQEARWLIKNIQQRFDTILRVTQAIVENQRHFFDHGEVAMRPLVLREIADEVGLHESTISRVTTQKYMMTPRGIYELKYFFGSSVATEAGGACSATAIRALIKQLVEGEDHRKPLSDNRIADLLGAQGILVARRTIAKYRESLHIQPASLRKSL